MFVTAYLPGPGQILAAFAVSVLAVAIFFILEEEIIMSQRTYKFLRTLTYFLVPLIVILILLSGAWR